MSNSWSYLFYDLVTNEPLAQLPLNGVSFSSQLNNSGTFAGSLNLADPNIRQALQGLALTEWPSRTALFIDLNGVLVWGGIVWQVKYAQLSFTATITGNEFWSYFAQSRRITWAATFTAEDVLTIAQSLITSAQLVAGGNIGVTVGTNTSGVLSTISWNPTQVLAVGQAVSTVASQSGGFGFDYMIDAAYDSNGIPQKYFNVSYPRRGFIAPSGGTIFDLQSAYSLGYTWPLDGTSQANTVFGIGATGLLSTQRNAAIVSSGFPLLEGSYSRTDITDQTTLDNVTTAYLDAYQNAVALPIITFGLDCSDPAFGTYNVGDDVRVIIAPDEFFTSGLDAYWRITNWTVTVNDQGVGTVANTFALPPDPVGT